ncbi:MAG: hypothetical protein JW940_18710 [Polyangiaceae bacterium]|nr:hypothetical protein [Polyangiaceae bacterium]
MASKTAYEELSELRQQVSVENGRARDAQLRLQAGKAKRQDAHDRLVAAHRDNKPAGEVDKAKKAIQNADTDLEFLAAEAQGLADRAAGALQAVKNFEVSANARLLDELAPKAEQVTADLNAWIDRGREIEAAYNEVVSEASRLVSASGRNPRQEGPYGHGLDSHLHGLRQQVANRPIPLPMPDFARTKFLAEQERATQQRLAREQADRRKLPV